MTQRRVPAPPTNIHKVNMKPIESRAAHTIAGPRHMPALGPKRLGSVEWNRLKTSRNRYETARRAHPHAITPFTRLWADQCFNLQ